MKIAAMLHGSTAVCLTMGKLSNQGRQQGVDEVPHRLNAMARFLQTLPETCLGTRLRGNLVYSA